MIELSSHDLRTLRDDSHALLTELVTPEFIYASLDMDGEGPYHAGFGRDSAITAEYIFAALEYGGDRSLALLTLTALKNFARYRGRTNNPATGEEKGKMPHEIRNELTGIMHEKQHAAGTNELPWFIDPADGVLKNWDTADATSLWIRAILRGHKALRLEIDDDTGQALRDALGWLLTTVDKYGGMIGFTGAEFQPGRVHSGIRNQGWQDSKNIYQLPDGELAPHPIKDVLVNAEAWSALSDGALYFAATDKAFSAQLQQAADRLQREFNDPETGFVLPSRKGLAQAIDGTGRRLEQRGVDQGAVLWARTMDGRICVSDDVANDIITEMMSDDLFNPQAGIRDYALGTTFHGGTNYHGSSHTYWPFMSGLVARGIEQQGDKLNARRVGRAMLSAINTLGTNIEMFIQDENDQFEPWSHPDPNIPQKSAREQAWTGAAVYYWTLRQLADDAAA